MGDKEALKKKLTIICGNRKISYELANFHNLELICQEIHSMLISRYRGISLEGVEGISTETAECCDS